MSVEHSEFKGKPIIALLRSDDDRFPMQFGVEKARLILAHIEEIENFVRLHDGGAEKKSKKKKAKV